MGMWEIKSLARTSSRWRGQVRTEYMSWGAGGYGLKVQSGNHSIWMGLDEITGG